MIDACREVPMRFSDLVLTNSILGSYACTLNQETG